MATAKQSRLFCLLGFYSNRRICFFHFVLRCCGHQCRQVLGYSFSSQISGTCDSQACSCYGDLSMGIKCSFMVTDYTGYLQCISFQRRHCLSPSFKNVDQCLKALIYSRVYVVLRRHQNQIQAVQVNQVAQDGNEMANFASVRKYAVCTFYTYFVFVVCYVPLFSCSIAYKVYG